MERRMAKDGAIIVVNDTDVDFYESVGFKVIEPEGPPKHGPVPIKREPESIPAPALDREIGTPVQEPDPKPRKPRKPKA